MAPQSKGKRVEITVRAKPELRDDIANLAALHDWAANDESLAALRRHVVQHDPATCSRCVELREGKA